MRTTRAWGEGFEKRTNANDQGVGGSEKRTTANDQGRGLESETFANVICERSLTKIDFS